tara:strand:- start:847 stop:1245 length:399 start_codon:yes stop_codon:yes gene_type:complete
MIDYTDDEFMYITKTVMKVLDTWNLTTEQTVGVLGLSKNTRKRELDKYRTLKAFPKSETIIKRLSHIVGISDALRTTFPRNVNMSEKWMKTQHRRFDNETPLNIILEEGINGLCKVRSELDCTFAWNASLKN